MPLRARSGLAPYGPEAPRRRDFTGQAGVAGLVIMPDASPSSTKNVLGEGLKRFWLQISALAGGPPLKGESTYRCGILPRQE